MAENWVTPDMIRMSVQRNSIYLTQSDALKILQQIDQQELYAKHEPRVKIEIWKGEKINGVDVTQHPNETARRTSHQFLTNDQGLAYMVYTDGKLNGFQPHVPGVQGFHALTSKTVQCYKGHLHDKCPTCQQEHDVEKIIAEQKDQLVKNLAGGEIFTKTLYLAQEIYDKRMETLDKLSAMYLQ
jgi:hypothetical protein